MQDTGFDTMDSIDRSNIIYAVDKQSDKHKYIQQLQQQQQIQINKTQNNQHHIYNDLKILITDLINDIIQNEHAQPIGGQYPFSITTSSLLRTDRFIVPKILPVYEDDTPYIHIFGNNVNQEGLTFDKDNILITSDKTKNVFFPIVHQTLNLEELSYTNTLTTNYPINAFMGNLNIQLAYLLSGQTNAGSFHSCKNLLSAIIEQQTVPELTFYGCTQLQYFNGLQNILQINRAAFQGCQSIRSLSLINCTVIQDYAFYGCTSLSSFNGPQVESVGDHSFGNCPLTNVVMNECLSVGPFAFEMFPENQGLLRSVELQQCKFIDMNAFAGLFNLSSVNIPLIESIGDYAFRGCGMSEVIITKCLQVGQGTFADCTKLEKVILPGGPLSESSVFLSEGSFQGCVKLSQINLDNVSHINKQTFLNCKALTQVNCGTWKLYQSSFQDCSGLVNCDFPYCGYAEDLVFLGCQNILTMKLPQMVRVNGNLLKYCVNMIELELGLGSGQIMQGTFTKLTQLKKLKLRRVESLDYNEISCLLNLEDIYLDCKTIYNAPVDGFPFSKLVSIDMNNLETITPNVFFKNIQRIKFLNLSSYKLPIEYSNFQGSDIEDIHINNDVIQHDQFRDCQNLVKFECQCSTIGERAFMNCPKLKDVITYSLFDPGTYAFSMCPQLKKIILYEYSVYMNFNICGSNSTTRLEEIVIKKWPKEEKWSEKVEKRVIEQFGSGESNVRVEYSTGLEGVRLTFVWE